MTNAIKQLKHQPSDHDIVDALRIVEASVTLAAIPGMASPTARELAIVRLREMIAHHPRSADVLAAVVQHLESYGP